MWSPNRALAIQKNVFGLNISRCYPKYPNSVIFSNYMMEIRLNHGQHAVCGLGFLKHLKHDSWLVFELEYLFSCCAKYILITVLYRFHWNWSSSWDLATFETKYGLNLHPTHLLTLSDPKIGSWFLFWNLFLHIELRFWDKAPKRGHWIWFYSVTIETVIQQVFFFLNTSHGQIFKAMLQITEQDTSMLL